MAHIRMYAYLLATLAMLVLSPAAHAGVAASNLDAADAAFEARDWDRAATLFRDLARENPQNGRFWYALGVAEYSRRQYAASIEAYDRAIAVGHNLGTSHYNRACCLALLGRTDEAVDALEAAIGNGLREREDLLRNDADLASIRESPAFRARILPSPAPGATREERWRMDIEYLSRRVRETHYDPFRFISRAEWDAACERIAAGVPTMKDHEIVVALMQLMARINDGHTVLGGPVEGALAFHVIPVEFYEFPDGVFVRAAAREYESLVGRRVVRVGDLPVREALDRVATVAQRDNSQQVKWMAPRYMSRVEVLDALGVSRGLEVVNVTVIDDRGRESSVAVKPVPLRPGHGNRALPAGWVDMSRGATSPLPLWRRNPRRFFSAEYLADDRIVYAGFHAVLNDSAETLEQFAGRLFGMIDAHHPRALVIDVRVNNGGNNFLARKFLELILATPEINRPGALFVITGRETFSACQNFCNWLDRYTDAVFVGEPTGSRPNFVGEGNQIILPCSGLVANASSRLWQDSVSEDARRWIAPDLIAEMTSDDYRNHRDPALDTIRAYLAAKRSAPGSR